MKTETFLKATQLDGRIKNVAAASNRLISGESRTLELTGLPEADRDAIRKLALDYLDAEENKAQAEFDAL